MKMKIKPNMPNFQRCQQFLNIFQKQKGQVPHHQLHKFVGRFDRSSLRSIAHFKPLQEMLRQLTPRLIEDKFITSNAHMMSNMISIYSSLNFYSSQWMSHSSKVMQKMLSSSNDINIEMLNMVYRAFVELNEEKHEEFIEVLRVQLKNKLVQELKQILSQKKYLDHSNFLKKIEFLHKYIRVYFLDPHTDCQILAEVFELLFTVFDKIQGNLKLQQQYIYQNCAVVYEFCLAFDIEIPQSNYRNFMKRVYQRRMKAKQTTHPSNLSQEFQRRGESVFEIRFQKHLQANGYWFERNIRVGLSQFDILIKGKKREEFQPFKNIDIDQLKKGQFTEINADQRTRFENMTGLWHIEQPKKLKEDIIVNLNGPFHYIQGQKSGLIRSQKIKEKLVQYYGYKKFKPIDYRIWQKETINQRSVTNFLDKMIVF